MNWHLPFTMTFNNRQAINIATLAPTIHFILGLWALYIMLSYFEKDDFEKIAKGICFSAVLITVFGIMQVIGFDPFGGIARYVHGNHFSACLDNPNIAGNYLCLSLPLFFAFGEKKKYIWWGLLVFAGVILSKSTLAIGCAFIGICFYALLVYRRNIRVKLAVTALIILFIIFCSTHKAFLKIDTGFSRRLDVWGQTIEKIKINPLFGQGLGRFRTYEIEDKSTTKCLVLHNDWLQAWVEIGLLGAVLLLLIAINSFRNFDYQKAGILSFSYLTSFLIFILLMCGSFPIEIAPTALLGLINFTAVEKL